jgi:hypothetical protein
MWKTKAFDRCPPVGKTTARQIQIMPTAMETASTALQPRFRLAQSGLRLTCEDLES